MRRSYFYHAQADHARRLADITIQQNVEEILRRVAVELDHLADEAASDQAGFCDPDKPVSRCAGRDRPIDRRGRRV
jgi:hypothetical protein